MTQPGRSHAHLHAPVAPAQLPPLPSIPRAPHRRIASVLAALLASLGLAMCGAPDPAAPAASPVGGQPSQAPAQVAASVETVQVPNSGDAADDPAIWVHPANPSLSTIIGTDKKGGLAVYDLAGQQIQYLADGNMNNADLRAGFPLGGQSVALVVASNRNSSLAIYRVDPASRQLENVAARTVATGAGYGACMYHSPTSRKFYVFVNSERGEVEQWELFATAAGKVDAALVRSFDVGSQTEGCVADDRFGQLYIGEEAVGIWKYGAEPSAGTSRASVDKTGSGGHLTPDVEGLAIYDAGGGNGYLIASSQGSSSYVVYQRAAPHAYVATFEIVAGGRIDAVSETDGIDVVSANLGPAFPQGLLVAQDGKNEGCNQNFKLVSWQSLAAAIGQAQARARQPGDRVVRVALASQGPAATSAPAPGKAFFPVITAGC